MTRASCYFFAIALLFISALPSYAPPSRLNPPLIIDSHTHLIGLGTDNSGCYVNPNQLSWKHPISYIKTSYMIAASGIKNREHADKEYIDNLATKIQSFPGPHRYFALVFAFSPTYDKEDKKLNLAKTGIAVPNDYLLRIVKDHPQMIPVGSVHPYQPEVGTEIAQLAQAGVRLLKILPNSMHFDPGDDATRDFFAATVKHSMVLIAHVGDEHSVAGGGIHNEYGNPYRYERWLKEFPTLKLIFAHVGSEGKSRNPAGQIEENFNAVLRLLRQYPQQTYADISAFSSAFARVHYLTPLLESHDIHRQLLFGSDYPLPNFTPLTTLTLGLLKIRGLISLADGFLLARLQRHNALAYNYQLLQTISTENKRFPPEVFSLNFLRIFTRETLPEQLASYRHLLVSP